MSARVVKMVLLHACGLYVLLRVCQVLHIACMCVCGGGGTYVVGDEAADVDTADRVAIDCHVINSSSDTVGASVVAEPMERGWMRVGEVGGCLWRTGVGGDDGLDELDAVQRHERVGLALLHTTTREREGQQAGRHTGNPGR